MVTIYTTCFNILYLWLLNIEYMYHVKMVKLSPQHAVEAYRVLRSWRYHIVKTFDSQIVVMLSALGTSHVSLPRNFFFLVLIYIKGWVNPREELLDVLGKLIKIQLPHRDSNSRPSGLYLSASTDYFTACPCMYTYVLYNSHNEQ
jgi:hypothetical protein